MAPTRRNTTARGSRSSPSPIRPVCSKSAASCPGAVELRNPYIDALCHLQLRALRALRSDDATDANRGRLEQLLLLTVNGIAAGLQNTG